MFGISESREPIKGEFAKNYYKYPTIKLFIDKLVSENQ